MDEGEGGNPERGELVAENRGWRLFDLGKSPGGWSSLKLVSKVRRPKGNFWLGWNGQRLSKSKDAALLEANHPEVFDWVVDRLTVPAA